MQGLESIQKRIWYNKVRQGFTLTVENDFWQLGQEVNELREAIANNTNIGEELADIVIMCYGLSEYYNINLNKEILDKVAINEKRHYIRGEDGKLHKVI